MSTGLKVSESGDSDQDRKLVKCILSHFDHVSVDRIHNLAFLCDYYHKNRVQDDTISGGTYKLVLGGCFSESVQKQLNKTESIEIQSVRIKNESVDVVSVPHSLNCDLKEDEKETVTTIVQEYGDIPPKEMESELRSIDLYRETNFEDELQL